jgi:hypothetical protein
MKIAGAIAGMTALVVDPGIAVAGMKGDRQHGGTLVASSPTTWSNGGGGDGMRLCIPNHAWNPGGDQASSRGGGRRPGSKLERGMNV